MAQAGMANLTISEMREFASFTAAEQRYIRRSLDIALGRQEAVRVWARGEAEASSIRAQYLAYRDLGPLRALQPADDDLECLDGFIGTLVCLSAFDLTQRRLDSFSAYRFLYERLLGAWVRPWLPGAFCGAAALPQIHPDRRKLLLHSISEAAATAPGWSAREPTFYPEWIDQAEAA